MSYMAYQLNPAVPFNGLGLLGALGAMTPMYADQVKIYEADLAAWQKEKSAYDRALVIYNGAINEIETAYQRAYTYYLVDKAKWDAKQAIYSQQFAGWQQTISAMKNEYMRKSQDVASKYGLKLSSTYPGCVSQSAHDYYQKWDCTAVKGMGATYPSYGDVCGMQKLPVCNYPSQPTSPGPAPKVPVKAAYPTKPTLRMPPQAPTAPATTTTTTTTPPDSYVPVPGTPSDTPTTNEPVQEEMNKANMVKVGLIAAVVVVGGVALYRTFT